MATIKRTDVASNPTSGSSLARAAKSGKVLPASESFGSGSDSSGHQNATVEPHNAQGEMAGTNDEAAIESSDNEEFRDQDIDSAVTTLNDYVQHVKRDLEFVVNEDEGIPVVKITDRESGTLIRQLPGDEVVDLARKLNNQETLRLFSAQV